jgi:hypothetical protein
LTLVTAKDTLRQLVERMSEDEARGALERLKAPGDDPVMRLLDDAPLDDEPSTPEEDASSDEAWQEYLRSEYSTAEEIERDLG